MNEAMVAEQNDESMDDNDFVEMGKVSEETKGFVAGRWFDGGLGWYGA